MKAKTEAKAKTKAKTEAKAKAKTEAKAKAKTKAKSKSPVPPMLPRERLTKKALEAISQYATIRAGDLPVHYFMVRRVLEAERMRRVDLYAWLEARGYRWRGGYWKKVS